MPAPSSAQKVAAWFESARQAQDELVSSYTEAELAIIADVFERFAQLWQREGEKVRKAA